MTLHIALLERMTLCGRAGSCLSLRWIARHFRLAVALLSLFGCRECGEELGVALRDARRIA